MFVDGVVTLLGQDKNYWTNFKLVNEASPAYLFLQFHPILFIIGSFVWFYILYWFFLKLKRPYNIILALAFISGHSWGSAGWIKRFIFQSSFYSVHSRASITVGWLILVGYTLIIAIIAGLAINQYIKNVKKSS